MTLFEAWLIFVSPGAVTAFGVISWITVFVAIIICPVALLVSGDAETKSDYDRANYVSAVSIKIAFVMSLVGAVTFFYPSQNQMYAMIGGYYGTNIEGVDELPENTVRYLNEKLTEHLEETDESEE